MAKKSRRARKKGSRNVSRAAAQAAAAAQTAAAVPTDSAAAKTAAAARQEYGYVIADLRQVVILAAAMFALLVGLSFFLG